MTQLPTSILTDDVPQLTEPKLKYHHHHHHHHHDGHSHTHGMIDPDIASSERGIWAVKWSLVGLLITAALQVGVFWLSGSVALLADLIHNIGDAMTAVPLGVAFFGDEWCAEAEAENPDACADIPLTLQERAYTSPIWYSPA